MAEIIFLHGASSSGKSTIARLLQARIERPFWHVSIDHLRDAGVLPLARFRSGEFAWADARKPFFDGFHASLAAYADAGNNPANWQWVAGSGADAAPYFRIFNPVVQGEKFDPEGAYIRHWLPELAKLPAKFIHKPWTAPPAILAQAGIALGREYPLPMVDHDRARAAALAAFASLRDDGREAAGER